METTRQDVMMAMRLVADMKIENIRLGYVDAMPIYVDTRICWTWWRVLLLNGVSCDSAPRAVIYVNGKSAVSH